MTKQPRKRLREQGLDESSIIASFECVYEASMEELRLQEIYQSSTDLKPYFMTRLHDHLFITDRTITIKNMKLENVSQFLNSIGTITYKEKEYEVASKADVLASSFRNSIKAKGSPFIYTDKFLEILEATDTIRVFDDIRTWAHERGIYERGNSHTQFVKLQEEAGELAHAILKDNKLEQIDALGDMVVVLVNLAHLLGYKLEDCVEAAYRVIKNRTGKMVNGTVVKDE